MIIKDYKKERNFMAWSLNTNFLSKRIWTKKYQTTYSCLRAIFKHESYHEYANFMELEIWKESELVNIIFMCFILSDF